MRMEDLMQNIIALLTIVHYVKSLGVVTGEFKLPCLGNLGSELSLK